MHSALDIRTLGLVSSIDDGRFALNSGLAWNARCGRASAALSFRAYASQVERACVSELRLSPPSSSPVALQPCWQTVGLLLGRATAPWTINPLRSASASS